MPPLPVHKNMLELSGETDAIMHEWEPRAAIAADTLPVPTSLFVIKGLSDEASDQADTRAKVQGRGWYHQVRGSDHLEAEEVSNGHTSRLSIYERTGEHTFQSHAVNQNSGAILKRGEGPFYSTQQREGVYFVRKHGLLAEVKNHGEDEDGNTIWESLITTTEEGSLDTHEVVSPDGRLLRSTSLIIRGDYRYTEAKSFLYDEEDHLVLECREFKATPKSPTQFDAFKERLWYEYDDDQVVISGLLDDGTESRRVTRTYEDGALHSSQEEVLVDVFPFEEVGTTRGVLATGYDDVARSLGRIVPSEMARH